MHLWYCSLFFHKVHNYDVKNTIVYNWCEWVQQRIERFLTHCSPEWHRSRWNRCWMTGSNAGGSNPLEDSPGTPGTAGDNILSPTARPVMYMKLLTSLLPHTRRMLCYWIKWIMWMSMSFCRKKAVKFRQEHAHLVANSWFHSEWLCW